MNVLLGRSTQSDYWHRRIASAPVLLNFLQKCELRCPSRGHGYRVHLPAQRRAPCILACMRSLHALPFLIPVASVAAGQSAGGSVFAFTDPQGIVHYSNVPADTRFELFLAAPREGQDRVLHESSLQRSAAYSHIIDGAARANRLEPALVTAVIVAESGGDPLAVSKRGARGLMQLMPATARRYGVRNVFDPEQNIRGGSQYLRDLAA